MSAFFFCKKLAYLGKNSSITQSNSVRAVLEIFSSVFSFVRQKVTINENVSFTVYASGIRLPDSSKLAINQKNNNDITIAEMTSSPKFFDIVLFLLSSLVTGPSFMPISPVVLELKQFSFLRIDQKSGNRKYSRLS